MEPILEADYLVKKYGESMAVDGISFTVEEDADLGQHARGSCSLRSSP